MNIKKFIRRMLFNVNYIFSYRYIKKIEKLNYSIMSLEDTLSFICKKGNSMVRFGDGEMALINGVGIKNYQDSSDELKIKLIETSMFADEKMLVCFPETLVRLDDKKKQTQKYWACNFRKHYKVYKILCRQNYMYGNSFVSRPYIVYKNHDNIDVFFDKFTNLLSDKDLLIIEGKYSRSGVGNRLFSRAKSIQRILCPSYNAFVKYDEILQAALETDKSKMVLIALGPTAKPLCIDLFKHGYWVLDIGHIDSEYEWFLSHSDEKVALMNKHTAEHLDDEIIECNDSEYQQSIIKIIE